MDKLMGALADFLVSYGGWDCRRYVHPAFVFGDRLLTTGEGFWAAFRNISSFTFKRYTSTKLCNQILHATKIINDINQDFLPYRVRIKWVKNEEIHSFLKSGQVIIRIKDDEDINKSFVLAVSEFVRQGLIHNVKRHLRDQPLVQAIDLCAVSKVLSQSYVESLSYLKRTSLITCWKRTTNSQNALTNCAGLITAVCFCRCSSTMAKPCVALTASIS